MPEARIDERSNLIKPAEYLKLAAELVRADKDIREKTEELASARGIKAGIFKRAKAAGADVDAMRELLKLKKMDDDDRGRLLETVSLYAEWEGVPMWIAPTEQRPQGVLFADDPEAVEAAERLRDAVEFSNGRAAAETGSKAGDNPHLQDTAQHAAWARGHDDWIHDNPGKQVPVKASTAPKGRTKKPAAEAAEPKPKGKGGRPKKDAAATEAVH